MYIKNLKMIPKLPPTLKLIEFSPEYQDQVKSLIFKVIKELRPFEKPDADPKLKDLDDINNVYKNRGRFWILLDAEKDRVIGTIAVLEKSKKTAKLKRLYLEKRYRSQKIGSYFLQHALDFCKKKKYQELELRTTHRAPIAIKLFEKFGFKKTRDDGDWIDYQLNL